MAGAFTVGIEEEYFLVDAETKLVVNNVPPAFFDAAKAAADGRITPEFLQPQVEVVTSPHVSMAHARRELRELRLIAAEVAARHGLAIFAAGTHPTAIWRQAQQTEAERYDTVMHDLQMIGQRDLLCGMHVHVQLPDADARVDVMYRMLPYLPLFLALSTSSPFWQSRRTGLMGYRLAAYDELPRTGVPSYSAPKQEFDAYVAALVRSGVIENSSFIWWAIRPSRENPTLELRAPDSCTLVEDTIAIAGLYRTLARHLYFNRGATPTRSVERAIAVENKWQAQRNGVHATFVTQTGAVTVAEMLERVIADTAADAAALGCDAEIDRCRAIIDCGTSADAQLAVFASHRKARKSRCRTARRNRLDRASDAAVRPRCRRQTRQQRGTASPPSSVPPSGNVSSPFKQRVNPAANAPPRGIMSCLRQEAFHEHFAIAIAERGSAHHIDGSCICRSLHARDRPHAGQRRCDDRSHCGSGPLRAPEQRGHAPPPADTRLYCRGRRATRGRSKGGTGAGGPGTGACGGPSRRSRRLRAGAR